MLVTRRVINIPTFQGVSKGGYLLIITGVRQILNLVKKD